MFDLLVGNIHVRMNKLVIKFSTYLSVVSFTTLSLAFSKAALFVARSTFVSKIFIFIFLYFLSFLNPFFFLYHRHRSFQGSLVFQQVKFSFYLFFIFYISFQSNLVCCLDGKISLEHWDPPFCLLSLFEYNTAFPEKQPMSTE